MHQTIHIIQDLMGLLVGTAFLGWALWRLAIWFGIISYKRTKGKASTRRADRTEKKYVNGELSPSTGKKRGAGTLSRQALYSARKHRD